MFQNRGSRSRRWVSSFQALVLTLALPAAVWADTVQSCHDGDTCRVQTSNGVIKVRLDGIDAPEADQPFGRESGKRLEELAKGKAVVLKCKGYSYNRQTCSMTVNGQDVQAQLVKEGLAWDYPEYSHGRYQALQQDAQRSKIGLWSAKPTSPYCWRWAGKDSCQNQQYEP